MKLRILGTSAAEGWPAAFCRCDQCRAARTAGGKNIRKRSCLLIDDKVMIDLPPDILCHCQQNSIDLFDVEHLLITHPHWDHLYANELLWRRRHFAHPWDARRLHVYGSETTRRIIDAAIEAQWDDCRLNFHAVTRWQTIHVNDHGIITAALGAHSPTLECFNYIIEFGGATVFQAYDTGLFLDETWDHLAGHHLNAVVIDCTNGTIDDVKGHLNIRAVMRVKEKMHYMGIIGDDVKFIATHFSHNGGLLHDDLAKALEPGGIVPAYDGMEIEVAPVEAHAGRPADSG